MDKIAVIKIVLYYFKLMAVMFPTKTTIMSAIIRVVS
jgi:hypothetical protein